MHLGLRQCAHILAASGIVAGGILASAGFGTDARAALGTESEEAATPGMPVTEDFEDGLVAMGGLTFCQSPLDSASTVPGCFPAGGIAAGLSISVPGTEDTHPLMLLGDGTAGSQTNTLATTNPRDVLKLEFAEPTNATTFQVWSMDDPNVALCVLTVDYVEIGLQDAELKTPCQRQSAPAATFAIGPGPDISSLTVRVTKPNTPGGEGVEMVDNIRFAHIRLPSLPPTPPTPTSPTPTPGATTPTVQAPTSPAPVDRAAPNTRVSVEPTSPRKRVVRVVATANEDGSKFQCRLDDRTRFTACKPTRKLRVRPGRHTLRVRAVDNAGNIDRSPARAIWIAR